MLRNGNGKKGISSAFHLSRNTVRKYVCWSSNSSLNLEYTSAFFLSNQIVLFRSFTFEDSTKLSDFLFSINYLTHTPYYFMMMVQS